MISLVRALLEALAAVPTGLLHVGRVYYNTTTNLVGVYTGAAWNYLVDDSSVQTIENKTIKPLITDTVTKTANYTVLDNDGVCTVFVPSGTSSFTFTDSDVNTTTDVITESTHGMSDGDIIWFESAGVLPTGIGLRKTYFVRDSDTSTFKITETVGGSVVDITSASGGGNHTCHIGVVVILPTAADNDHRIINVKKVDDTDPRVAVVPEGSETLDGFTYADMINAGDPVTVQSDGTNWHRLNILTCESGTYSPTGVNVYGGTLNSIGTLTFVRVLDVVTVSGTFFFDPTSGGANLGFRMPLPITSSFANTSDLGGAAGGYTMRMGIRAQVSTGHADFFGQYSTNTGSVENGFSFTYRIL